MFGLTRRGMVAGLAYAVASPAAAAVAASSPRPAGADPLIAHYTSVQAFGAKGDGLANDTHAIQAAIAAAPAGGTVWFPPGTYMVSKTLKLRPGTTYRGSNPESSVIRQRNGANLIAVMADENFLGSRRQTASGIQIEDLGIDGNASGNKHNTNGGHGLVLMTDRCLVRHVIVSNTTGAGIVLEDSNATGTVVIDNGVENRIQDCTVIQPGTYGVWIRDTHHLGRQTDGYLLNNVVKDTSGDWAMRIERAAGWFIANNHVYHCARNGIYLSHVAGTYFYCNEVDKFGLTENPPASYYGLHVQYAMGRFRPSIFIGNVCATPEGNFPRNLYTYYQLEGDQFGQSNLIFVGNVSHNDPIGKHPTVDHAYGSTAFQYDAQPGGTLNVSDTANFNDGTLATQSGANNANVQLSPVTAPTPLTIPLAAGVAGGVVVGGIGMAARSRQARQGAAKVFGSGGAAVPGSPKPLIAVAETLSRWEIDPLNFAPDVGDLYLTYFVPFQHIEVNQITFATGDRAAGGAAVCRVGLYEVMDTGELKLLGATRNGAGRFWTAPYSVTTVDLDPRFGQLPLLLTAGIPYAYAEIQVGGSPATRVGKVGNPGVMALEPRGSARYAGYGDLPAALPPPDGANASGIQFYARLTSTASAQSDQHR
jgi:hypothetical protein